MDKILAVIALFVIFTFIIAPIVGYAIDDRCSDKPYIECMMKGYFLICGGTIACMLFGCLVMIIAHLIKILIN